jgi:hypothetical protein
MSGYQNYYNDSRHNVSLGITLRTAGIRTLNNQAGPDMRRS